jgi:hypothetical protein
LGGKLVDCSLFEGASPVLQLGFDGIETAESACSKQEVDPLPKEWDLCPTPVCLCEEREQRLIHVDLSREMC